ncbi:hypothetical protein FS837_012395 [Tulasnella sp. UAMH 9824]|nr:hypothetical protein FS837_012395 [Tulasnella sp. UAMH 9824]
MSSPKFRNKFKVKVNGYHTPDTFVRQWTDVTFDYIASFLAGNCTVWQACHAVLNASDEGCLTTDELESAIRSRYPAKDFQRNTLSQKLSQSEDFAQVFLGGRTPGRWFLTGETKGGERNTVNGFYVPKTFVRKHTYVTFRYIASLRSNDVSIWKACHATLNASPEGCLTTEEIEIAIRFHYPLKEFQKTTLSNTLSQSEDFAQVFLGGKTPGRWFLTGGAEGVGRNNASRRTPKRSDSNGTSSTSDSNYDAATDRDSESIPESPLPTTPNSRDIVYQSDGPSPSIWGLEEIGQNGNPDFVSQVDDSPLCNTNSILPRNYMEGELTCMMDGIQELHILSLEPTARPVLLPSLLPTEGSSCNVQATQELTATESLSSKISYASSIARQGGPEPDILDVLDIAKPMACGAMIAQQPLPLAYHTMVCWICSEMCAADDRSLYHSLVSADAIPFELPWKPEASSEQPEAGTEVPTAGVQFGEFLGFLGMDL